MFEKDGIRKRLSENYPILSILVGIMLVSLSIGPYQSGDTLWEYEAASGVMKWGMPYVISWGNFMNQPPLGFYIEALFFKIFGSSTDIGVILVTLFGLGSIVLVYKIGKEVYSKSIGLFAAALFALTPWELVLSRSFFIDTQCLFFSLLCLFIGIISIRKDSLKLFIVTGALFAAAFLTKFFAVFILIPLLLFYFYYRPKNLRHTFGWFVALFLPVLISSFLWYQVISGQGVFSIFNHSDFAIRSSSNVTPSFFFVFNFLANYGLGWLFVDAAVLSFVVYLTYRKFRKSFAFDLICVVTILSVVGVNTFLGAVLNLNAPYLNAIKYDYQALPFFSLLAASMVGKAISLLSSLKSREKLNKLLFCFVALGGLGLVAGSMFFNMSYVHLFSPWPYLLFRVEIGKSLGYSLFNPDPVGKFSLLMNIQSLGFGLLVSGLVWASRYKLYDFFRISFKFFSYLFNPMRRWIDEKNVLVRAR
ncbi:MAG: glycosyltransferase family 39 protein [Candidatus Bathyarchaeia archaeon]|jgi:4-amino-4-deoxy-L-arabinose transferase-like glycosyltransferase